MLISHKSIFLWLSECLVVKNVRVFLGGGGGFGLAWYLVGAWIMKRTVTRFFENISVQISSLHVAIFLLRLREGEGYSYISSSPSSGSPSASVGALYCCTVVKWGKHYYWCDLYNITNEYVQYIMEEVLSGFWLYQNIFRVFLQMSIMLRYTGK